MKYLAPSRGWRRCQWKIHNQGDRVEESLHTSFSLCIMSYPLQTIQQHIYLGRSCWAYMATVLVMLGQPRGCLSAEGKSQGSRSFRLPGIFLCTGVWNWLGWYWESWIRHCEVEWQSPACQYLQVNMELEWLEMRPYSSYFSAPCDRMLLRTRHCCFLTPKKCHIQISIAVYWEWGTGITGIDKKDRKEEAYGFQF